MIFADLQSGDAVFLDANIFIYHFAPDPALGPPCSQLLQRLENQEFLGFTWSSFASPIFAKFSRQSRISAEAFPCKNRPNKKK
jgi:predicted nucleic acid-binding protein